MMRVVPAVLVALVLSTHPAAQSGLPATATGQSTGDRLAAAVAHFDRAFYELTPHKRHAEAATEFDLAAAGFERVLADAPRSIEAHTYLARIYTARKDFKKAAQQYDRLSAIDPLDLDVLALAAQAHLRAGNVDQARARLLEARLKTNDPDVLARLDEYLVKVDALKR
jgi:tetratricopeptide (TPR) repeat protein